MSESCFSSIVHKDFHEAMMAKKDAEIEALRAEIATPVLVATNRLADALADARAEIAKLRAEREELRELLWWVEAKLQPELNMSNYDHGQVCELNANATEAVLAIRAALAEKGE